MWTFNQKTGEIRQDEHLVGLGYAGAGEGKNNPSMQAIRNAGPLPCGLYQIGEPHGSSHMGPFALELIPHDGNEMFGREGFFWHGDDGKGTASEGCICSSYAIRLKAYESTDRTLKVIRGEEV